jgi:endonuclease III
MILNPLQKNFWPNLNRLLEREYGNPRHGNLRDPLDELIYIILSAKTRIDEHQKTYRELRTTFPDWELAFQAGPIEIERIIRGAGLSRIRSEQIFGVLRHLKEKEGSLSLKFLSTWPDIEIERYLTSLPGVGLKTARCVMLYSFDRQTFPVDTHTLRLFANLGIIPKRIRHDMAQEPLQNMVPSKYRYKIHVNIVAHGRTTCIPGRPKCGSCALSSSCLRRCM